MCPVLKVSKQTGNIFIKHDVLTLPRKIRIFFKVCIPCVKGKILKGKRKRKI